MNLAFSDPELMRSTVGTHTIFHCSATPGNWSTFTFTTRLLVVTADQPSRMSPDSGHQSAVKTATTLPVARSGAGDGSLSGSLLTGRPVRMFAISATGACVCSGWVCGTIADMTGQVRADARRRTLVPAAAAMLVASGNPKWLRALPAAAVQVGARVEVDTGVTGPGLSAALVNYMDSLATSGDDGVDCVNVDTVMYSAVQVCGPGVKIDLVEDVAVLCDWAVTAAVVDDLLSSDRAQAVQAGRDAGWTVVDGDGQVTYSWTDHGHGWPGRYGGPGAMREVSRTIRVTVRYAKWRDCRRRRLHSVEVVSTSTWPRPTR